MKKRLLTIIAFIVAIGSIIALKAVIADAQNTKNMPKEKVFRIERSTPKEAIACIECHKKENPGLFADWAQSRHASANITCYDCHKAEGIRS